MVKVEIETIQAIIAEDFAWIGASVAPAVSAPAATAATTVHAAPKLPFLSQIADDYLDERGAAVTAEVRIDIRAVVRDLIEVVGDKPVSMYNRDDVRTFKEVVLGLPANWRKRKDLRRLDIVKASQKARELNLPRQRAKTITIKRNHLRSIFAFAESNYDGVRNLFAGGSAWLVSDVAEADQRDAFTADEVRTLMASKLPGELAWLVPLGLYTGARLNELAQLASEHVRTAPDGTHYVYFAPKMRRKTAAAVRSVPLHPKLIALGFLDHTGQCNGRLFPDLAEHRSGRFSDAPSKAFPRHLRDIGLYRAGLSFHSLRHTFAAVWKRERSQDIETRERLLGHKVAGVSGRYGSSFEAEAGDMALLRNRADVMAGLKFDSCSR